MIGVLITPALVALLLPSSGGGFSIQAVMNIGAQILLPFALGQLARLAVEPAGHGACHAEPDDQHVGRLEPPGVVRDAELVGQPDTRPEGQQEPDADEGHERPDGTQEDGALRWSLLPDREEPQRGHGDAAADEQEHAREVQEEGPVACHPPSNLATAKQSALRWKSVA